MKYYLIAGEASGDLHGANLIRALRKQDSSAEFRCWGGDRMEAASAEVVKHYRELAFMGFIEVAMNLRTILGNIRNCKEDITNWKPDVLVLVDYPGFNMRIARWAKEHSIKVIYYISPQIWAWKQNRGHALKRDVDRMLCILPFEKEFYERFNMEVDFVGHPLIDAIANRPEVDINQRKKELGLDAGKPVIALLPGSRKQEISTVLPLMIKAAANIPGCNFVIASAPSQEISYYHEVADLTGFSIVEGRTYDLLEISDAAMVTSGTATLETALFGVPQVVCYKGNWLSYWIARQLVKVPYISLVNLIAGREVVKELIQAELSPKKLAAEIKICLEQNERFKKEYEELRALLGGEGASEKAAAIIVEEIKK